MKRLFVAITMLLGLASSSMGGALKGKVTDSEGHALPSVSVVTDAAGVATQTNVSGEFLLQYEEEIGRVTFSSIGYKARQFRVVDVPDVVVLEPLYYEGTHILVRSNRAQKGVTPVAFENLSKEDIERDYTVGEFPLLLTSTPNLYAYADGGSALGYSYMRLRGFDDKRVVTYINGVPLNDPEDHATYFVDLPDFAANVSDIQVQRGVGNSLYGDASFGGSVNIVTSSLNRPRHVVLAAGYGEYTSGGKPVSDIYKQSLEYSSGLIDGRWSFSGRFTKQKTGGYRYRSWYAGWAYSFSVARLDHNLTTELYVYGGPMHMHLAYYGASHADLEQDRRANSLNYANETDNFNQPHYELHNTLQLGDRMTLSNSLYYIRGKGYYEQFKEQRKFAEYNISPSFVDIDTSTGAPYSRGDLVRQKWVEKNQVGWNPRLDIEHEHGLHALGGSFYYFESDHWGEVVWAQHVSGPLSPRLRYYQYTGQKYVASVFAQENYRLTEKLSTQLAAQLRYARFDFDQMKLGAFAGHEYDADWLFLSPRAGVTYALAEGTAVFMNVAVASRAPSDDDLYDADDPDKFPQLEILSNSGDTLFAFGDPTVASERLWDVEFGVNHQAERFQVGGNFFWMRYTDENVFEGGVDDVGRYITVNVDRAVHMGVELSAAVTPVDGLTLGGNASYNHNRVKEYVDSLVVYDQDWNYVGRHVVDYKDKTTSGFPEYLGQLTADYKSDRGRVTFGVRFAGKQFAELLNVDSLAIDPHAVAFLSASYTFRNLFHLGNLRISGRVDNLFDSKYITSGYGYSYGMVENPGDPVTVITETEYFVAAERSFYGQVSLELF
ncbi:MAG: TonB-dependent receptor [candidate division Zixibacteria bacterium]|nr:TonB-dependent receptor [candidate division Zixibacteria bacterium]